MIFEVFNMYVMSTVRFYESICISVLICIDLRWIQCCSIQSVQSVLPILEIVISSILEMFISMFF